MTHADRELRTLVDLKLLVDVMRPRLLADGHRARFAIVPVSGLHAVRETFFNTHKCALTDLGERGLFLIQKVRAKERAPKARRCARSAWHSSKPSSGCGIADDPAATGELKRTADQA